jgi:hypothetical protein
MRIRNLAVILLGFLAVTCTQDPIFFIISKEPKPTKPRIEGAPTNMVVFERNENKIMCVASGRLHWYKRTGRADVDSGWDANDFYIPQPEGKIISLAVTPTRLYALCFDDHAAITTLRYIESKGNAWRNIPHGANHPIQSIYTDPEYEQLFAGTRKSDSNSFAIYYLDPDKDNSLKLLRDNTSLLSGAVYRDDSFYLCTRGEFFQVAETEDGFSCSQLREKTMFMGMIKLKDDDETVIATARNGGGLYKVNEDNSLSLMRYTGTHSGDITTGNYATGALALWEDSGRSLKMLIAGVQGHLYTTSSSSSYSHGYVEFEINNETDSFDTAYLRRDTSRLQSVDDADRYMASLGKHPINHLFQVPLEIDPSMTFFASTQTAGLWSYRDRPNNGGWQWNAEE